ncbi:hypothetical protein HPC62_02515 [Thermoleptolyngbya sichuanensis A183]|uniref:Uncharacterized protein n=1 Tax=Thermoleptolyngbya sichuanensis A183 TaxID=2737172 RepID=A0A6M8B321_9CYAN|nr:MULTISPECIES: hypothetical protein [Thermoleptolyngbya]QKD81194.1 hypothetical protein HPC62_02515 [Thermoleptolyngbya sichuanensis A183]
MGDRPSFPSTDTFRRSPSFHSTDIFGRSPPRLPFGTLHTDRSLSLLSLCG